MSHFPFSFESMDASWVPLVEQALFSMDPDYLTKLAQGSDWLPGKKAIFNAFSLPRSKLRYILVGESPYPRAASANGYAFWDASVQAIWSNTGFSKEVNRATSLRNFIKMLLLAKGDLTEGDLSQAKIANLNKSTYIQTGAQLFSGLMAEGVLLLNASLVFQSAKQVKEDARQWLPFMKQLFAALPADSCELILLGKVAHFIQTLEVSKKFKAFVAEHPYNLSFITNQDVQDFFRPFHLLETKST